MTTFADAAASRTTAADLIALDEQWSTHNYHPLPVVVAEAEGAWVTDVDGKPFMTGVEAVIDKDLATELLAREVGADLFVMATDVDAVYTDWGTPDQQRLGTVTPQDLSRLEFPAGSMGPKVDAAAAFVEATGKRAAIGGLANITDIVAGKTGTQVVAA